MVSDRAVFQVMLSILLDEKFEVEDLQRYKQTVSSWIKVEQEKFGTSMTLFKTALEGTEEKLGELAQK